MVHLSRLRVVVVHNCDFEVEGRSAAGRSDDPTFASRADVVNAARDVAGALASRGHEVTTLAVPGGDGARAALRTLETLVERAPDLVFNLCESLGGDARHEAVLPALLDLQGLAYSGSGPQALGLALRKDLTKRILVAHGVPTPAAITVEEGAFVEAAPPFPLIVKPTREDASVGISRHSVVHSRAELESQVAEVHRAHRQPALGERYIEGRELYVSLVAVPGAPPEVLPMHEIDFSAMPAHKPRIVSYDAKWDASSDEYAGTRSVRAMPLDAAVRARCEAAARAAFACLELRDYARVDLRLGADGVPYVIDVNPNCDLSDGAGVSRAASFAGIGYAELIERICRAALARHAESEHHVHPATFDDPLAAGSNGAGAPHPAAAADRSAGAVAAGGSGRPVLEGRGVGRARADRRGAR